MKINFINSIIKPNFKGAQNAYTTKPEPQSTNDIKKSNGIVDYNVKVPLKYTSQGIIDLPFETKAHMYKLENGQRVAIIPTDGPTIVKTYVNVGSMNEYDDERGISHFIEHSLFNGSDGLEKGEFFDTVNKMGASTNAATGFSTTNYYIKSNLLKPQDLEHKIKIHASMLETPKFSEDMIEKEKGPIDSEISMILDNTSNLAINNSIKNLFGIKSTSKDLIGGNTNNIDKLTRKNVIEYYKNNYYPTNMVTVITGDVTPDETIKLISKYFKSNNKAPKVRNHEEFTPIQKSVRNDIISPKATKTHVSIAFVGPENSDSKDKIISDAFNMLMLGTSSARLSQALENIQSTAEYSTDRMESRPTGKSVLLFNSVTSENNSENVMKAIFEEVSKLENNPPTDNELNIIKKNLKIEIANNFEFSSSINSIVGNAMLDNDLDSVVNYNQTIDSLTSKDLVDFAKKYLNLNKASITVVHPKTTSSEIKKNYNSSISFKGSKKQALDLSKIEKYSLQNNIELYTNDTKKDLSTIDISLTTKHPVKVIPGTAEIMTIMLNRGTEFSDEKALNNKLAQEGIKNTFHCDDAGIYINSSSLATDSVDAIKAIKETILNPRLTEENFEYAKSYLKEEFDAIPPNSTEAMLGEMYKGQRHGVVSKDIKNNIDNISLNDVKKFYNELLNDLEARCAISGPMKNSNYKNSVINEMNSDFPTFRKATVKTIDSYKDVENAKIIIQNSDKSQAQIELGYKFKTNDNLKDSATFVLLETILGGTPASRLFSDLREKQKLAYQVNTRMYTFDNSDIISLFIKTTTDDTTQKEKTYDNLQKSIDGFNKHINKLMTEEVSEEELESAKLTYKNRILNFKESSSSKNDLILTGAESTYGVELNNKALDIVDEITPQDIKIAANYIFSTKPILSIVATKDTIEHNSDYLKKLNQEY